ncbi:MAG: von Willebrand factor type A domain-containing protein [Pseudomonadota bacterium]
MSDPLDKIRAAMARATPDPDPTRRLETLDAAQAAYDRAQGLGRDARPTSDRPTFWTGIAKGVGHLLSMKGPKHGLLAAGTAIAAAGVVLWLPALQAPPPIPTPQSVDMPAPVAPDPVDAPVASIADLAVEPLAVAPPGPGLSVLREPTPGDIAHFEMPSTRLLAQRSQPSAAALAHRKTAQRPLKESAFLPDGTEVHAHADPHPVSIVTEDPVSTFSVDVDTASYAFARSSLLEGRLPSAEAVRVEEFINYFPYSYPAPEPGGAPFELSLSLSQTPWNPETRLLKIGLQGAMPAVEDRPPLNLVFLIDTSGSMQQRRKLPLLKRSLRLMLPNLSPEDEVAIVTYAGQAGVLLEPTSGGDRERLRAAIDQLDAHGATAGQAGLQEAYAMAQTMAEAGEVSRVILATDGDFNVGVSDPSGLEAFIAQKRAGGTYLTVLGFGRGTLDDATMQALAQAGNGQAAYIDTLLEAQKVLVDQLTGALFPIADDVKVQVEFNPASVAEYRLIGYETRALRREEFNNDQVDAGEIGAGHSVTALYEVTPVGSPAILSDPLRYGGEAPAAVRDGELAFVRLRYKAPGETSSRLIERPIPDRVAPADVETRFAAAVAGFGQLLRGSPHLGVWGYADALALGETAQGDDPYGYRREAIGLMRLAESLSRP